MPLPPPPQLRGPCVVIRYCGYSLLRLHILRVLKRNGVNVAELLTVYKSFVRSVLEYCAPVWPHLDFNVPL